jgi:chromosome partitioning protein
MKIALIAKKGGAGKTTICILLHEAFRQTGQTAAVRDYDRIQGSAAKSLSRFGGTAEQPGRSYDFLLIDTPPSLSLLAAGGVGLNSPVAAAAASEANVVLVPTSPSPYDIWETEDTVQFVQRTNPQAIVRVVLNRTRTGTLLSAAVNENLEGTSVPVLPVALSERQCYQHAGVGGWAALDPRARQELLRFTVAVSSLK